MTKNKSNANKPSKHKINNIPPGDIKDFIYSMAVFIAFSALIFYPPYVRGLFFPEDRFTYHILTAMVFLLAWIDKISKKDYGFLQTPLDWAILAYAGAYLLSLVGVIHIEEAFFGFLKALNYFMIYWTVIQMVRSYRAYVNILRIILDTETMNGTAGLHSTVPESKFCYLALHLPCRLSGEGVGNYKYC